MTPGIQRTIDQLWDDSAPAYRQHVRRFGTHRQITTLLAASVTAPPDSVLDFGCGPGNSTRVLRRFFPDARLVGLDSSAAMIDLARLDAAATEAITFRYGDGASLTAGTPPYDLVICSNSFFHVVDKSALLDAFDAVLSRDGQIVFSMYESVYRPRQPVPWPYAESGPDTLTSRLVECLHDFGYGTTSRTEDRAILSEDDLVELFAGCGFRVRCAGILRLRRHPDERLSFFRIPAVAKEMFPDLPPAALNRALDTVAPFLPDQVQERNVFAFAADRIDR